MSKNKKRKPFGANSFGRKNSIYRQIKEVQKLYGKKDCYTRKPSWLIHRRCG